MWDPGGIGAMDPHPLKITSCMGFYIDSAGHKGGGHVPPSPKEALSALKKVHPHNNSAERKGGRGSTDRAVSVTRASYLKDYWR